MRIILAAFAIALAVAAPALAQTPQLPTCDAPEHRALDFWVGEWDAYRADNNQLNGRSSITRIEADCVILEEWTGVGSPAFSGRSFNVYDRVSGNWEQYWVSSTGNRTHYVGGPIDNGMRYTTPTATALAPGQPALFRRITLLRHEDGAVSQRGESSADGQTWALNYLLIYRPRAN
jgi:hypothetical protein